MRAIFLTTAITLVHFVFQSEAAADYHVYWDTNYGPYSYRTASETDAWGKYHSISSKWAKIITNGSSVIRSYGQQSTCDSLVGRAYRAGHLTVRRNCSSYLVLYHWEGPRVAAATNDANYAWKKYYGKGTNVAKVILVNGQVQKSYGNMDAWTSCIGAWLRGAL